MYVWFYSTGYIFHGHAVMHNTCNLNHEYHKHFSHALLQISFLGRTLNTELLFGVVYVSVFSNHKCSYDL